MASYLTLAAPIEVEIDKIKGSRFIAQAAPIDSGEDAAALVQAMRAAHPGICHACWAYRLGPGKDDFRYSDDGEPNGSAGQPILKALDGRKLTNVAVVVVRHYGGTKLGTGGLVRAYMGAAAAALDEGEVKEVIVSKIVRVAHGYELSGAVKSVLVAHDLEPMDEAFGASVVIKVRIPEEQAQAFADAMVERTAGKAEVEIE